MKWYIKSTSEPTRGVFWVIDGELLAFPFIEDNPYDGVAKSGSTYNHKKLWPEIKPHRCNVDYDYYPRGRVEFKTNGTPIIYMNPNIDLDILPEIRKEFGLRSKPEIRYDYSEHYKCYLDR